MNDKRELQINLLKLENSVSMATPREIIIPHRKIPLEVPKGVSPTEFFNSSCNLRHLARENGLLRTPEGFLLFRKAIGHSNLFDTSIIFDTSEKVLNPMGRPVRRDELTSEENLVFSRMTRVILEYMLEKYPDPKEHLVFCGEASLDATWPLNRMGVPSIRMIHNHFMVFENEIISQASLADENNSDLTDSGHNGLFLKYLSEVYLKFFDVLDLEVLKPIPPIECRLKLTGYPQGLPSWEVNGGLGALSSGRFWHEYDLVLKGFLDFYRTFFTLVSSGSTRVQKGATFPDQIEDILLFSDQFHQAARMIRLQVIDDPMFANEIRWQPAYKQLLYRDDVGRLIVTISQNSVGNAITELLGLVVRRVPDAKTYSQAEPALVKQLLEVRDRLVDYNLGNPLSAPSWPHGVFVPCV